MAAIGWPLILEWLESAHIIKRLPWWGDMLMVAAGFVIFFAALFLRCLWDDYVMPKIGKTAEK